MEAVIGGDAAATATGLNPARLALLEFALHEPGSASREWIEAYIRSRFAASHGACVSHFLPSLISVGGPGGPCAAVGLSPAATGRLFAESYLSEPAECAISRALDRPVQRRHVLEIGNLVSTWKGSSLLLFVFLSELIDRIGFRWVLFTATREVERLLARLGYTPTVLHAAEPFRLPDGGAAWGRYYSHAPQVMTGEVQPAVAKARRSLMYRSALAAIEPQVERVRAHLLAQHAGDEALP